MTHAKSFFTDARIIQAKNLIKEALADHQLSIQGIKDADPQLKNEFEERVKEISQNRGISLFYDYLGTGFGHGPFVELADGSIKYDFITGIGVHYLGHSHPELISHSIDGAIGNTIMQGNLQQNVDSQALIKLLVDQANINGAKLEHCFLTSSGVMANENALKMAFYKRQPANRVLAFDKCFHGRTLSISQITDKPKYRDGLPETLAVDYIPFYDYHDHKGSIERSIATLKKYIARYPGKHAAMLLELIQGEAGSWPGHKEFFKEIIKILKENNITVIADEVQTFGRTKNLFAFQYFELDQDIDMVCIGKNSQVCATLFKNDHKPGPGLISQTFTSSSVAIAASYYIINTIVEGGYLGESGKIEKTHQYFESKLQELHKKHPDKIEGPYGIGAMIAFTPYKGDFEKAKDFTFRLFKNGVLSFTAGGNPTRVRFLLPMGCIETKHIDDVIAIIDKTL
ncbi:MAG: aminotransferase class III-fold pyridoxal phosphate-dependent enzyme [Halobacteriovoraceae bacterium]|nr:aminotransferase class III-fold pyridoxal phosphate-dependent enzyme [Halobacteriovoraceae bacterium]